MAGADRAACARAVTTGPFSEVVAESLATDSASFQMVARLPPLYGSARFSRRHPWARRGRPWRV